MKFVIVWTWIVSVIIYIENTTVSSFNGRQSAWRAIKCTSRLEGNYEVSICTNLNRVSNNKHCKYNCVILSSFGQTNQLTQAMVWILDLVHYSGHDWKLASKLRTFGLLHKWFLSSSLKLSRFQARSRSGRWRIKDDPELVEKARTENAKLKRDVEILRVIFFYVVLTSEETSF